MKYNLIPDGIHLEEKKTISHELASKQGLANTDTIESAAGDQFNTIINHLAELRALLRRNLTISLPIKEDDMLTMSQAASYSGFSKSFLYKKTATNAMNFYKPNGKIIFFKRSDIDYFKNQGKVLSKMELKKRAQLELLK